MKIPCFRRTDDRLLWCPTPPRLRTLDGGSTAIYRQCQDCGESVGNALPKSEHPCAPAWDHGLVRSSAPAQVALFGRPS